MNNWLTVKESLLKPQNLNQDNTSDKLEHNSIYQYLLKDKQIVVFKLLLMVDIILKQVLA